VASFTFNIAKGRVVELYNRVKSNDPSTSAFILIPLAVGDTAGNRQDDDTVAAFLAATPNEAGASWGRKTLTDSELAAFPAPNDTDNRYDVANPSVTWTAPTAGQDTVALVVAYDANTGAGTDADLIPLTYHDFAVTADGNDVILMAGNIFQAS
jgi:hypothetical protein